ncbi:MAG: transcription-repair coupling factor, partial [Saprospiraceae bacterium]
MSNIKELIEKYHKDRQVTKLNSLIASDTPVQILCKGLVGAMDCFVLVGSYQQSPRSHIYIASDKEEAAYIYNTLQSLFDAKDVHFFPDSFKRPLQYDELDKNNVLIRTETINKIHLNQGKKQILVSYPEAIFEKAVDPTLLEKDKIEIIKNASLDINTMIELLVMYGFDRVEFVYQPGQF